MVRVYFGLGSNMGDRPANLDHAIKRIGRDIGEVASISPVYETAPYGYESDKPFLNLALIAETELDPARLIQETDRIEKDLGRTRQTGVIADRTIDVDILLYGSEIISGESLVIPHPRMHLRRFVMQPLSDIASGVAHPVLRKTMTQLLDECPDTNPAAPYNLQFTQRH